MADRFTLLLLLASTASAQYFYAAPQAARSCNATFNTQRVSIDSSSLLPQSDGAVECTFTVQKSSADVCSLVVDVKELALRDSPNCRDEFLAVGDSRLCGGLLSAHRITLRDAAAVTYRGSSKGVFRLDVRQESCPERQRHSKCDLVLRQPHEDITSPGYPNPYPPSASCRYLVLPASPDVCELRISFRDFSVEESFDCQRDSLAVGARKFCGALTGYDFVQTFTNSVSIEFQSDASQNGRGFHVSLDQIPCVNGSRSSQTLPRFFQPAAFPECCGRIYTSPYLVLKSPGFLEGTGSPEQSCRFTIFPATPQTCKLTLRFRHFWVGDEDVYYGCINGFVEMDGRRFCGCKDGLTWTTFFDGGPKYLWYQSRGSSTRGFVIEAVQEECRALPSGPSLAATPSVDPNTEIEVFSTNITSEKAVSRFFMPTATSRCYQWGAPDWVESVRYFLLNAALSFHCPASTSPRPPLAPPIYPPVIPPISPPAIPPISPPSYPPAIPPISPPFYPPAIPPISPPLYPVPVPPIAPPHYPQYPRCQVFSQLQGVVQSPGYPQRYPNNLRCCYRFRRLPGMCHVHLAVLDFDLEWSYKCWKDYLLFDRSRRFCGESLLATASVLSFRSDGFAYLDVVTDWAKQGRGFRAVYRMVPCGARSARTSLAPQEEAPPTGPTEPLPPYPPATTPATDDGLDLNVTPV